MLRSGRLDHPLAQLLTGLLTVFALFGDDVQRSVYNERVDGVAPDGEFALERVPADRISRSMRARRLHLQRDECRRHDLFCVGNPGRAVHYDSSLACIIPVLCAGFYFFGGFYWLDVISRVDDLRRALAGRLGRVWSSWFSGRLACRRPKVLE